MRTGQIVVALVGCVLVAVFVAPHGAGFLLYFVVPFLLLWILYGGYVFWKRPDLKRTYAITLGLWLVTVAGLASLHLYYHLAARSAADAIAQAVTSYKDSLGAYPPTLEAAGVTLPDKGGKWRIFYGAEQDKPQLFYPATFQIFATYWYNFDRQSWEYLAD